MMSAKRNMPKESKKGAATISDVAKLAGVAPSTVSHTLNQSAPISEETKKRVNDAIEQLQYTPNATARALRKNTTHIIGVILQDIASEFYAKCAASILEEARKDDYNVLVGDAQFNNDVVDEVARALVDRRVDGLIFIGGGGDEKVLEYIKETNIPLVLGDRNYKDLPSVEYDNAGTMRQVVNRLCKKGCRRFAYIGEPLYVQVNLEERYKGFLEGLKENGIAPKDAAVILDETLHHTKIKTAYNLFLKKFAVMPEDQRPQAILTTNDQIAQGIISGAQKSGLNVPQDLAVVGFDDIDISAFFMPSITTIAQNEKELGKSCYQMLKSILKGQMVTAHSVLPQKIVVRQSALL